MGLRASACVIIVSCANVIFAAQSASAGITLDLLGAGEAYDVSASGSRVVGNTGGGAMATIWTNGSPQNLGVVSPYSYSLSNGVSGDGSIVVGRNHSATYGYQAFRWTSATGSQLLGDLPGGPMLSEAYDISADGSVIVGYASDAAGPHPIRWTSIGMEVLPSSGAPPNDYTNGYAKGASANGSVIVGALNSATDVTGYPFRWTAANGYQLIGGTTKGIANDVSDDGDVIIGQLANSQAFRWSVDVGMQPLGFLDAGYQFSTATATSSDGSVVVGQSWLGGNYDGFVWDPAHGMRSLTTLVASLGLDLQGYRIESATAVSADGNIIAGRAFRAPGDGAVFVLQLPEPSGVSLMLGVPAWLACRQRRKHHVPTNAIR
jgi:uncharacterized membrane protein